MILRTFSNLHQKLKKRKKGKLYTKAKETTSKSSTTEFLFKIPNRKKIYNEHLDFNLYKEKKKTLLDKIIKCINSQTSTTSPGNELAPVLLDVYDFLPRSWKTKYLEDVIERMQRKVWMQILK